MNRRRGASLVELLVVVSSTAAILSLSAELIYRGMRTQSESRRFFDGERAAWRLAKDFRNDAHAASEATVAPEAVGADGLIRLEQADGRVVVYRRDGAKIVRMASSPGAAESREEYPLAAGTTAEVQFDDATRLATLSVVKEPADAAAAPPRSVREAPIELEVLAIVGRDHRSGAAVSAEDAS